MTQSVTVTGTIIDGPLHTPPAVRREAATSFMVACEQGAGPVVVEVHGLDAESNGIERALTRDEHEVARPQPLRVRTARRGALRGRELLLSHLRLPRPLV